MAALDDVERDVVYVDARAAGHEGKVARPIYESIKCDSIERCSNL